MKNCCDKIYKKIKMPDSFDFSMDRDLFVTYFKPVGVDFDKLPNLYYTVFMDMINDFTEYMTFNPPVKPYREMSSFSFYPSLEQALESLDTTYSGLDGGFANWVQFIAPNPNLGKWSDSHPAFLRYKYEGYKNKSLEYYKNPNWLLNFNFCGVDGKFEENKKFRLGGCNTFEVKWKLRVKPILFMGIELYTRPVGCMPMVIWGETEPEFESYTYHQLAQLVNLINSTETKEGSRWLGLTPIRLETGIYNYDTGEQTPIVNSQGGYPQVVTNINHIQWEKTNKDKLQCNLAYGEIKETILGPEANTDINYYDVVIPTQEDIFYYMYGGIGSYSEGGQFLTQVDNLNAPVNFLINKQSLKIKGLEIEGVIETGTYVDNLFKYMNGYVSPPTETAGLTLNLEYNINGEWVTVLTQNYDVSSLILVDVDSQLLVGVSSKTEIDYVNLDYVDLTSISGDVDFLNSVDYDYRYNFLIGFSRSYKKIDTFGSYTPQIQNYTQLSEEFTFELDGFTNVNLDKGDIGIYLKVLPDADNSHNINLIHKNDVVSNGGYGITYPNSTHILCNEIPGSNECYPWGELGISSKTGWQKIENPEYFPLLPLNRNIFNNDLISSTLSDDELARLNYRYNLDINPNAPALYLMIEEGWVSVEPTCENC